MKIELIPSADCATKGTDKVCSKCGAILPDWCGMSVQAVKDQEELAVLRAEKVAQDDAKKEPSVVPEKAAPKGK